MADRSSSSIWFVVILTGLAMMVGVALVEADYTRKTSILEAQKIEAEMGPSTLEKINRIAGGWYEAIIGRMESSDKWDVDSLYSEDPVQRQREYEFTDSLYGDNTEVNQWLHQRTEAFKDMAYWVMRRVALFLVLLPLWIPLAILAVFHGLQDREIKKTDFGYTSPVLNHWARRVMSFGILLTFLVFFAPIAIDPIIFPIIMAALTVALGIAVGNIQKRL